MGSVLLGKVIDLTVVTDSSLTCYAPSDSVRDVGNHDGTVLLDIQRGLCLSMTPLAARIWELLKLRHSIEQITDCLALEFPETPKNQIRHDVIEFTADLQQKGILTQGDRAAAPPIRREWLLALAPKPTAEKDVVRKNSAPRLLVWKALLGLAAFDLFHFGSNFPRIHALVQSWSASVPPSAPEVVDQVCRAINRACFWYPKRVLCLQRSAVTTCLLRSCGVPAQMIIGAQKCPFKAHAWTEVDGCPINERRDVRAVYLVWERC